ncbi:MAG: MFS transporter [Chloroherpetonaceae bacterium]|nr:MFS transporter [Chthonomonadaceae bacterium]MDW8207767.1 MFS transporter [Chloroherpetonaceae bacterium]
MQQAESPAPATVFQDRAGWYWGISAFWFASSFKWFLILQLLPVQVARLVPADQKDLWWGRISGVGAVEAMIGPAVFGYWSDRCRSRWGRRQPFIAAGAALTAIAMFWLAQADRLWMFLIGYLLLQISDDVGTGPYAAIVPDYVPEHRRGHASGILSLLQLLAQVAAAGAGFLLATRPQAIFLLIAVINLVCAAMVIGTLREDRQSVPPTVAATPVRAEGWKERWRHGVEAWIAPWRSSDFRWVWLSRFLNALGFYVILNYLVYYLQERVQVFRIGRLTPGTPFEAAILLALVIALCGALSAAWGGGLADRVGRKRVVLGAGWVMFLTLVPFALVPHYTVIVLLAPLFGLGYGAYLSAAWALAADTLPSREDTGKDMGIWQMSVTAPQVIAGFGVSLLIYAGNQYRAGTGYTLAFLFAACVFLGGALLVRFVRGAR